MFAFHSEIHLNVCGSLKLLQNNIQDGKWNWKNYLTDVKVKKEQKTRALAL